MKTDILGVGFDCVTVQESVSMACELMRGEDKAYIVTPNPEIVWMARRNEPLRAAINKAAIVLPDAVGIIIASKILGTPLRCGRVPGIDFITALFEKMAESGMSVFLLGAKPGVAQEAGQKLAEKHKGLVISGAVDGYFTEDAPVIDQINEVNPDLLLVCLGAPKQELWMAENALRINAPLCAGLGGSLDIFAGRAKRAPAFFCRTGLEWLYRLIKEPRRIRRMIKIPLFILAVIWKRLTGGKVT